MSRVSAGVLLCRRMTTGLEFLLGHPGGPYFAKKDDGSWGILKGLVEPHEEPQATAVREFFEETGLNVAREALFDLGTVRLKSGKQVYGWAVIGDCDPSTLQSNTFELEWPPRSGLTSRFPEVDRFGFFDLAAARIKMIEAQHPFLERAGRALSVA